MSADPRLLLAREPMHGRQILAISTLTVCTAAEGFDVYSVSCVSASRSTRCSA